ncbi:MAG TPA: ShlB/FhaC/HecB family hemolysin secretion/activation protein [Opitutaceae bacterium]|nr:ShlB/FhaC/HecB family hemolysin secretion/activation protein [Opitutaceae bacterium]
MFLRAAVFFAILCAARGATNEVYFLKHVVIADTEAAALAVKVDPASRTPTYVDNVAVFTNSDFPAAVTPYIGRPITSQLVNELSAALSQYARSHDRLIAKVEIPNQNVAEGTLRFAVVIGRFKDVAFRGNKYFSSRLLEERLGVKPGDEIRLSVLENAVNWVNTNPFRRVKVIVNPLANQPGEADLLVGVQDARPWRFSLSVDNYGNAILGQWHYTGAVQAGNLWGRDHQATYQFVTTDNPNIYQAHVFDYRVPLPWRHFLEFTAAYSRINPTFGINGVLRQTGENESADLKYTIPINSGENPVEVHAGLDFKRGNNNLEYAGTNYYASNTDTFQLNLGGSVVHHDKHGGWALGASVNLSPGYLDANNSANTYTLARYGSTPRYAYANVTLQRLQSLGGGWQLSSRLIGQISSTNLLGGEQLTIGGPTTVRGYNTNIYAGDEGFLVNEDLMTPTLTTKLDRISKKLPPLETRFVAFYDAGNVQFKHRFYFDPQMRPLASAGLGLRLSVDSNFSLNFDYGWQITHLPYANDTHGYGHVRVTLAF